MKHIYLYHGTNMVIAEPAWNAGSRYRDFGQCFYTTYSYKMAKNRAEQMSGPDVVNRYIFDWEKLDRAIQKLKVKRFLADAEWARFVYNNRTVPSFKRPSYDIIIGPLADRGLTEEFAKIKTHGLTFDEVARNIEYTKYKAMQVCFCSERAVKMLTLV